MRSVACDRRLWHGGRRARVRTNAYHHAAVRVADIERAGAFYVAALGGRWTVRPIAVEGEILERAYGPYRGLKVKLALIGFAQGYVELCEFLEPRVGRVERPSPGGPFPHVAVHVDDLDEARRLVEANGGRILSEPGGGLAAEAGQRFFFCEDPDGNALEVCSYTIEDSIARLLAGFPEGRPTP
jgi:catechol 2,3-dioxygenase-like lactoylglutathione lyase family enzyme